MNNKLITLFTRTPLHVGAGNSVGVVDSPIMRERHTQTPIIPGSSLKGVLADLWNDSAENFTEIKDDNGKDQKVRNNELKRLFGSDDPRKSHAHSGTLLIGEARVLAFPLRSAKGGFAWITCPHALKKFECDTGKDLGDIPEPQNEECYARPTVVFPGKDPGKDAVILEEYRFNKKSKAIDEKILKEFNALCSDSVWEPENRLVIVSDDIFSYFVANACEVVTRIKINDETGTVDEHHLFNQEQVPSETLFYAMVGTAKAKDANDLEELKKKIEACGKVLQIGGDATIGLGFCSVKFA